MEPRFVGLDLCRTEMAGRRKTAERRMTTLVDGRTASTRLNDYVCAGRETRFAVTTLVALEVRLPEALKRAGWA